MKFSLRRTVSLMVSILFVLYLAACSSGGSQSGSSTTSPAANNTVSSTTEQTTAPTATPQPKITLTVSTLWSGTDPKEPVYKKVWAKFQQDNPNITLNVNELPADGYSDKENIWAASGGSGMPDVVLSDVGDPAQNFVNAGLALDLTPYFDADPAWKNSFVTGIFNSDAVKNGKIYFMPNEYYDFPLWANKSILDKYNLPLPQSWSDFMDELKKLKDDGVTPFGLPNKSPNSGIVVMANIAGASGQATMNAWNDALLGKGKWSDPKVVEVFRKYQAMAPYVSKAPNAVDGTTFDKEWIDNKVAFQLRGPWQIAKYEKASPEGAKFSDREAFLAIPYIDPAAKGWLGTGIGMEWMINSKIDKTKIDAGIKLLKAITTPDVTLDYLYSAKEMNGIKLPQYDASKIGKLADTFKLFDTMPDVQNSPSPYPAFNTKDATDKANEISQLLIDNKITPEKAAAEMDTASASQ